MESILARIAGIIQEEKEKKVLEKDKEELKKAVLDRIGCGFAAVRIAVLLNILTEANSEKGCSAIWGTNIRTSASNAALINGSSSSHIEADIHDSMIPATLALGEEKRVRARILTRVCFSMILKKMLLLELFLIWVKFRK